MHLLIADLRAQILNSHIDRRRQGLSFVVVDIFTEASASVASMVVTALINWACLIIVNSLLSSGI